MLAVILAGGLGTRLRPYTLSIPKPLLPLGDAPILDVIIRQLGRAGFERVVITLAHMPHLFTAFFGDGSRYGLSVEYRIEEEPLGTAGAIRLVGDLPDHFLVMNGDILTTLDYGALMNSHRSRRSAGTIAVSKREHQIDYGVVRMTSDGRLDAFDEKPTVVYAVSMGINVLANSCVEYIPAGRRFDMPDLMKAMVSAGRLVACYETDSYWQDIGRLDDYARASRDYDADPSRFLASAHTDP